MISNELQRLLREHDIDVYLKDDRLAVRAKRGSPRADVLDILRSHKDALTEWLRTTAAVQTPLPTPQVQNVETAPASVSQQALWAVSALGAGGAHHTIPLRADLVGPLDRPALTRAFARLGQRHAALRTAFRDDGGTLWQIIGATAPPLKVVDLQASETRVGDHVSEVFDTPFDIEAGPLFRGSLIRQSANAHVLLIAGHHMILDGASVGILLRELGELYRAEVTCSPANLSEKPFQLSDYVDWQRRLDSAGLLDASRTYWRDALRDAPIAHNLPLDYARPTQQTYAGDRFDHTLDDGLSNALLALATTLGTTPFTLMTTAFGLLLARHSNEDDIVLSTPVANRNRPEFEDTVGFLANVVPLRLQLDLKQPFAALLGAVQQQLFSTFDHQDFAFERIVEVVNPTRNIGHNPLSQIMIAMDDFVADTFMMHDIAATLGPIDDASAKFDLQLAVRMQNGQVGLHWTWATDLFAKTTIHRLNTHFEQLLQSLVADPNIAGSELGMMSPEDTAEIMELSCGEVTAYDPTVLCHDVFAQFALGNPEAHAIRDRNGTTTYGTLNARADTLAQVLVRDFPQVGAVIAVLCDRCSEFVLAQLGILKAGHVFVPIAPDCPEERFAGILKDADISLVLTADGIALPRLPDGVDVINLSLPIPPTEIPAALPNRQPDDPAYIVFTSGSTGRPKGAVVPHRGLRNMTLPQVDRFGMTPGSIMTVSANVAFDSILWEIWPTLVSGGCLVMTPDAVLADPALLSQHLCAHQPTHFWLPTGMLELFCSLDLEWPDSIGMVFTGGDRLLRNCLPARVDAGLVNIYGPTECSVWATCHAVTAGGPEPAPIGRPLPNTATFITDAYGHLLPRGAVGEIVIAGDGVGLGYLGRSDLTEGAFLDVIDHPTGYDRLYRSGDLGRWREDGTLDCLGRIDAQVKIRGFRVEPGEIASMIVAQEGAQNAFVHVDEIGVEKRLIAFVVPSNDAADGLVDRLRQSLTTLLPAYMVPTRFILLDALPLTANGKIDRRALAETLSDDDGADQVNTASPRDQIELGIYKIWRETLVNERVGIRDNFFDVGGTSISAIKVIAAVNRQFKAALQVADLFQNATIEMLAAQVRKGDDNRLGRPGLIDLKSGEHQSNVVCVHPAGGTAFCYLSLSKLLPANVGVFGIQAPGVNQGESLLPDLTAMAQRNIDLIGTLLDQPLVLTGASFGGTLGFEMMRLLADAGHDRCSVVMLDTEGIDDPDILRRIQPVTAAVFRDKLVRYNGMYPGIDEQQIDRYHQIYNHHLILQRDYLPSPNRGRCVLLQASDDTTPQERLHGQTYWRRHCTGALRFLDSPGDHATMLEAPAVEFVAKIINEELEALAYAQ